MNKGDNNAQLISIDAKRRIASDIREMSRNECVGIHYQHDQDNILHAKAAIFGIEDTPYWHGIFLFEIEYSNDYPYSPPLITFINYGSRYRLHPNIYTSGKVCLSVLNTWPVGRPWNSCMTIKSVLINIQSVLTANPIVHEPGIPFNHPEAEAYTEITRYVCLKENFIDHFRRNFLGFSFIKELADKYLAEHKHELEQYFKQLCKNCPRTEISVKIYGINLNVNYEKLMNDFTTLSCR